MSEGPQIVSDLLGQVFVYGAAAFGLVAIVAALCAGLRWASHLSYMAGGVGSEWGGNGAYRSRDGSEGDRYGLTKDPDFDWPKRKSSFDESEERERERKAELGSK